MTMNANDNTDLVAANSFRGNNTGSAALGINLTVAQLLALLSPPATPLSLANGGFNANLTASNGGIVYSTATAGAILAGIATANRPFRSGAATTPAWSACGYPNTAGTSGQLLRGNGTDYVYSTAQWPIAVSLSTPLYASSANVIDPITPVNRAMLISDSSGVPQFTASTTHGQLYVGRTGNTPVWATPTATAPLTAVLSAGTLSFTFTGGGLAFSVISGTSATLAVGNAYSTDNASLVTLTLPTSAIVGDIIEISGRGAGGWKVAQNSGQTIRLGSAASTTGVTGSLDSANRYDVVTLRCIVANTDFTVVSKIGSPTVT